MTTNVGATALHKASHEAGETTSEPRSTDGAAAASNPTIGVAAIMTDPRMIAGAPAWVDAVAEEGVIEAEPVPISTFGFTAEDAIAAAFGATVIDDWTTGGAKAEVDETALAVVREIELSPMDGAIEEVTAVAFAGVTVIEPNTTVGPITLVAALAEEGDSPREPRRTLGARADVAATAATAVTVIDDRMIDGATAAVIEDATTGDITRSPPA
jgi:hypothetical protein